MIGEADSLSIYRNIEIEMNEWQAMRCATAPAWTWQMLRRAYRRRDPQAGI
jgi:hypothetical protein